MKTIQNPILKGFNPDPSIIRVGEDYYIATSTFEWFPGVQIHHSKDLVNWELIGHPLNRKSQLDMLGVPDSCGVWAPCLTYDNGTFYLVYSNVKSFDGVWKDTPNYLVTTDDIRGEWSEPIYLSSSGFDGSLFHDEDGRKWFTSMIVDHRKGKFFGGIIIQEYDNVQQKLIGKSAHIFEGSELGITEGPHIYQKNGYYYLLTAEGGTEYGHAISLARSESLMGPYEIHPENPVISARNHSSHPLQRAGHGDIVETPNGDWYCVFLVGRPLTNIGRCILGRETAIEKVEWREDGWLYASSGSALPRVELESPSPEVDYKPSTLFFEDFESDSLNIHFQSLRIPVSEDWLSLSEREGFLRLYGRQSLTSKHHQSLIARRVQAFHSVTTVALEFSPESFQQMAGLVCYYNTSHYYYLHLSGDENGQSVLNIIACNKYGTSEPMDKPIQLGDQSRVYLRADFNRDKLQFFYSVDNNEWQKAGEVLDGSILSDDYVRDGLGDIYRPAFTGSFVGVCCQDLTGQNKHADFDWFTYEEL
ncbi:glycoside hydrolase family 43 protein [Sediminitomix flava]|uniref:Xylan 1,4-beta-xylosidase n=1 Tax=Sediminitomix flava TaxID=379075 RepID=A0A315Z8K9_SEDFL|nr:glycoside hydrolase family 43 protein [Sediminitomix flava]PWJ41916.1 xylan 1,4-beta-xylosidase [Sediminitomix flava]